MVFWDFRGGKGDTYWDLTEGFYTEVLYSIAQTLILGNGGNQWSGKKDIWSLTGSYFVEI